MKDVLFLISIVFFSVNTFAQETIGDRVLNRTKEKAAQRGEQKTEDGIDNILNKAEDGFLGIFKKKNKKKSAENDENQSENSTSNTDNSGSSKSKSTKKNSKFDFEAGTKELYFDNFERLSIGDFPKEFNTNASGEVATIDGKVGKWLSMTKNGAFIPDNIKKIPKNFTLEFEVGINTDPTNNYPGFGLNFSTDSDNLMLERFFGKGTSIIYLHPSAQLLNVQIIPSSGSEINNEIKMPQWNTNNKNFAKISLWRQDGRLRVYVNEDKLVDLPRFFSESKTYDFAFFRSFFEECEVYLTNIRFAVAGADTRNTLITEGRFVTNGILFDTNSDNIKPESGSVLKEMAKVLKENPTVRVKIIGHTDSDGADTANLTLSKKRAAAVKIALNSFYGIDATRMETDGKGESQALNKNASAAEKAQNRRVEFIKL